MVIYGSGEMCLNEWFETKVGLMAVCVMGVLRRFYFFVGRFFGKNGDAPSGVLENGLSV